MRQAAKFSSSFLLSNAILSNSKREIIDLLLSQAQNLTAHVLQADLPLEQLSPLALAYIGDAVYELYVRSQLLTPPKRINDYHRQVVTQVKAESQAAYLKSLESYLTTEEKEIIRRGRNAVNHKPKRLSAKIYQQASSLETLIGYLYLTDCDRLKDLLTKLDFTSDVNA